MLDKQTNKVANTGFSVAIVSVCSLLTDTTSLFMYHRLYPMDSVNKLIYSPSRVHLVNVCVDPPTSWPDAASRGFVVACGCQRFSQSESLGSRTE